MWLGVSPRTRPTPARPLKGFRAPRRVVRYSCSHRSAIESATSARACARLTSAVHPCQPPAQVTECLSMFRVLFLAATAAALAGCAGSESATQAKFRADDAKCKSYGAEHGTDDYVQCRLAIDMQKANAERAAASLPGGR